MSGRTRIALVAAVAALSLVVVVAPASAGQNGPNNENAKKCQSYLDWVRADGSAFQSSGECTAYAAKGAQLVAKPPPLSEQCSVINNFPDPYRAAGSPTSGPFNAGETITLMASNPDATATGVEMFVNFAQVDSSSTFPATLTYTFPATDVYVVSWRRTGLGNVDWLVSCAAGS